MTMDIMQRSKHSISTSATRKLMSNRPDETPVTKSTFVQNECSADECSSDDEEIQNEEGQNFSQEDTTKDKRPLTNTISSSPVVVLGENRSSNVNQTGLLLGVYK